MKNMPKNNEIPKNEKNNTTDKNVQVKGNKDLTEIVFILDRSGSMGGLEQDTIGGFNSMIEKQKKEAGSCFVTTVLFDSEVETLHDRVKLEKVAKMTDKDYFVRGCTALLDAIGMTIQHIAGIHKYARPEDVPAHTIFVITTDGMENSSHEYTVEKVKQMIEEKKEKGWEFLFLGANIDAVSTAKSFGIAEENAVNYHCDAVGTALNYECLSDAIGSVRKSGKMKSSWRRAIDEDFERRG